MNKLYILIWKGLGRLVKGEPNELVFVYGGGILSFLKRTRKFFKAI